MSISSLGHSLTVESVSITADFDTRINVKKRRASLIARTVSDRDTVNLAYVMSETTTPDRNLCVSDRSATLIQNRIPSSIGYTAFNGSGFSIATDSFVVTNEFTTETATQPSLPLFYKHTLKYFNDSLTDFATRELISYSFADADLRAITESEYSIDTTTGTIYHNHENAFNANTGLVDVLFVVYSVRYTSGGSTVTQTFRELLDSQLVFNPATIEDIDEWGTLETTSTAYLVNAIPGSSLYDVILPISGDYAYKEIVNARIRVLPPLAGDLTRPWYVRISNGSFVSSFQTSLTASEVFKYWLPDYNTQSFAPYPPYKHVVEQIGEQVTGTVFSVGTNISNDPSNGLYITVIVEDQDGLSRYAYTTDPALLETSYDAITTYTDGILSVDAAGGFIELANTVLDTQTVYITYFSEAEDLEFVGVDFNPVNNIGIINGRICFYIVPESTRTGTLSKSLYYLEVDNIGRITYCSQAEDGPVIDPSTQRLLAEDFNADGSPRHDFYYDAPSTASGLRATVSGIYSGYLDEFSFVDKYTVESVLKPGTFLTASGVAGGLVASGELISNMVANPQFLPLADVYVGEKASPSTATIMDVRVQGGGIKEDYELTAIQAQPETRFNWDINGAVPYPAAMAFLVEIPKTLLTEYGGNYTIEQIRPIVERHMQLGGYAVIRTYGIDPVLTTCSGQYGKALLEWPSYGSAITYNVYYSRYKDSDFATHNASAIADDPTGNSYTLDGLALLTDYYVYIGAVDSEDREFYGPTYRVKTAAS